MSAAGSVGFTPSCREHFLDLLASKVFACLVSVQISAIVGKYAFAIPGNTAWNSFHLQTLLHFYSFSLCLFPAMVGRSALLFLLVSSFHHKYLSCLYFPQCLLWQQRITKIIMPACKNHQCPWIHPQKIILILNLIINLFSKSSFFVLCHQHCQHHHHHRKDHPNLEPRNIFSTLLLLLLRPEMWLLLY